MDRPPVRPHPALMALIGALLPLAAAAQYKVVSPDGSITYTDRPVSTPGVRVQSIGPGGVVRGGASAADPALPAELRSLVARFPVTLITGSDCAPCDSARAQLRQRGIPFAERTVSTEDDIAALQRLSNGRTLPTLQVGQQVQRGYAESDWAEVLDLAGYPRESKLPRDYAAAAARPLAARAAPEPAAEAALPTVAATPAARPQPLPPVDPTAPKIRF